MLDVHSSLMHVQNWRWVNEGKSSERPKWGYVTEKEGDSLTVRVRTLLFSSTGVHEKKPMSNP